MSKLPLLSKKRLFIDFVEPCLTSIYQPPDVVLNSPIKRLIWEQYHDHANNVFKDDSKTYNFKAGDMECCCHVSNHLWYQIERIN